MTNIALADDYLEAVSRSPLAGGSFRVVGIAVVKDESDIIEYFVRYNLRYLDALIVIDNASADSTRDILERLRAESLPLVVIADDRVGHFQATRLTHLARVCTRCLQTEYIVPLDADEIIDSGSRDHFLQSIRAVPDGSAPLLLWRTHVPVPGDDPSILDPVRRIGHRRQHERQDLGKVVIRVDEMSRDDVVLREGNHGLATPDNSILHAVVDGVRLAHFPVRSAEQFVAKALTGQLAIQLNPGRVNGGAFHWKAMCERVAQSWSASAEMLSEVGAGYSDRSRSALVHDPLDVDPAPRCRYASLAVADAAVRIAGFLAAVVRQHPVFPAEETPRVLDRLRDLAAAGRLDPGLREIWCAVADYCAAADRSARNVRLPDIRRVAAVPASA